MGPDRDSLSGVYWPNATALRHVGFCPACQKIWKVRDGLLVHHGYERPGTGEIHGDCFGVKRPPHELSPETAQAYLERAIMPRVRDAQRNVDALREEPERMRFERWDPEAARAARAAREAGGGYVQAWLTRDEVSPREWETKLSNLRHFAQRELDDWLREQKRLQLLIDTWEPRELGSVEEEIRKEEQTRAERKAIVEAKRAAIQAKKDAYDQAVQERKVRRDALLRAFDAEFATLLRQPPGPERDEAALLLLQESRKKEHKLDYPNHWFEVGGYNEADAAHLMLVELGLTGPSRGPGYRAPVLGAREVSARLKALRAR